MPAKFLFDKDGTVKVRVRIKRFIDGVPHEVVNQRQHIPNLRITESDWKRYVSFKNGNSLANFLDDRPDFARAVNKLNAIRVRIDKAGYDLNAEILRTIINEVVDAEENEEVERLEKEKEQKKREREDDCGGEAV